MKKTKVIIPALGLLLLSTAASVTGTVAWFAANANVTATGMSITATTDSTFLVISKSSDLTANAKTVALTTATGNAYPTNWVNTGTEQSASYSWVTGAGTSTSNGALSGNYSSLTISEATANLGKVNDKIYYVYDTVYVGLASGSSTPAGKKLVANATFTATAASAYNACLTVGLDVGSDMSTTADFDEELVLNDTTVGAHKVSGTATLVSGANLSTTATSIKIYVFFDGDNSACTTANALSLNSISLDLEFELVDA